jgi:enoyl-CoA hydratase/carnithine racemase
MEARHLRLEHYGHVALITLDRPEKMNAFTGQMAAEWSQAYRECDADDRVHVIVVTGAGRAFCSGADMSGGASVFDKQDDMSFSSCPVLPAWKVRKPVIAALNGHAIGVGFSLALQCDFRFVAQDAKYGLLQVRRGVLADGCMHWLLPRLTGLENALELLITGKTLNGDEMVAYRLARAAVANDEVLAKAMDFANSLAKNSSPYAAALAKRLVWQSLHQSHEDAEKLETAVLHRSMGSDDAVEGGLAYVERREPVWKTGVTERWPDVLDS